MTSDELRAAFLSFYESKGHKVVPSSSLIPHRDPTLLLNSAGMVQMKPYFLGQENPPSLRLASCQKCFRTTDIERVGDATHCTFFEMLGNFSIGDYFKKETIAWAWEFATQILKLPSDRLWASIYLDDDDTFKFWRDTGMPEARIRRFGEEDNFWGPAGDSGPCGPDSEIFYDLGKEAGCGKPDCAPNDGCNRFIEIGTLVFMQYNQDKSGKRTPLPKPSIDTGWGVERNVTVLQGKTSVYETDLFAPLLKTISKLSGKKYGNDKEIDTAIRVVAEHSRGITFLIADGVMPSNEGRGYVLRRLLRRAALFGKRLGLEEAFLSETAGTIIKQMKHVYPELGQREGFILKVIKQEETRFDETLNTGLELLDIIIGEATDKKAKMISGNEAFKLYDTYGFPLELTREIATDKGLSVDIEGFEREMEKQREKARAAGGFQLVEITPKGLAAIYSMRGIKPTNFVGYHEFKHKSIVISPEESLPETNPSIVLDSTPFYGEMGGQVGDIGEIRGPTGRFVVTNTILVPPGIIVHQGKVVEGYLLAKDKVTAQVDKERRMDIQRNHTATHLLQAALRQVLGEHVQQRGSLVAPERFRFDFSHLVAMTGEEISRVQEFVNEKIRQDLKVYDEQMPYKTALAAGVTALFDEKYGDTVRVLRIGKPPVSAELCGGTHAGTTGEIGFFHILSESSVGAGLRRIEAVTGRGAEKYFNERLLDLERVAEYLETKPDEVVVQAQHLATELKNERKQIQTLQMELSRFRAESLISRVEIVNGIRVLAAAVPSARIESLREMSDLLNEKLKSVAIVLGTVFEDKPVFLATVTPDLVAKGYDAGKIVREVAKVAGGGGGGKATLAQAGGKDKSKLDEALRQVKKYIEGNKS